MPLNSKTYNPEIHHRHSIRLKGYDYSQEGLYFITICVKDRECLFGDIINGEMLLNEYGELVEYTWNDLPNHNPNIQLGAFCIMPNHIHGIIEIIHPAQLVWAGSKPAHIPLSEILRQFKTLHFRRGALMKSVIRGAYPFGNAIITNTSFMTINRTKTLQITSKTIRHAGTTTNSFNHELYPISTYRLK